nr:immunoglobulin-like and fibronectin type III domain-containing protein 1 [Danio rerio]|eukprot:XP_021333032.1 immunoglobulin-like and fibronectin type III domain-containing protein 1 [Danio rerio]
MKKGRSGVVKRKQEQCKEGEIDPRFWEVLLSAARKDYERICHEYGVTDFRWMLRKLNQKRKEREAEQSKVSFTIMPDVEFSRTLKDTKVAEGQDAVFECALLDPVPQITWCVNDVSVENGDKYVITVSEDQQVHKLAVKNCTKDDKGVYSAIAGLRSSQGTLDVEASGTSDADELAKHLAEDKARLQREKNEAARRAQAEKDEAARRAQAERDEAARKAKKEQDDARRAQAERDEAARRAKADQDKASRKAKADQDEAARKAQEEQDEAAKRSQAERDEAARRAQAERDEAARRAHADREAAEKRAAMMAKKEEQNGSGGSILVDVDEGDGSEMNNGGDGTRKDGKGDGLDVDGSRGDGSSEKRTKRARDSELVPNCITEHGVHFLKGLSDAVVNIGESAELGCKLSSEDSTGLWYKDGKKLVSEDGITVVKDGAHHKLIIHKCQEGDAGKYKFEAEGRKSEASLTVEDPPKIDADALGKFSEPIVVKAGENASFKLPFSGKEPFKIQWFKGDEELLEGHGVRIEKSSAHSRVLLTKCQRKDTGEIKIKVKNEFATMEAASKLIVLDRPSPPQGPVEIVESSLSAIEFKWRSPKDDGGCPVTNYNLERQQLGRNTWTKIGDIPGQPVYRDTNTERGRKYCYRIRAKNSEGLSDIMTTNDIAAGTLGEIPQVRLCFLSLQKKEMSFPGSPAPPKVVSAFKDCVNLAWLPPSNTVGGSIIGYNVEKRKKGSNFWSQANLKDEPIREKKYAVKDVMEGVEYEFRVSAVNTCGPGEPSGPSECVIARDPKKPPGKVKELKISGSSYTSLSLSWTKPTEVKGEEDEAKGYFVEIRPAEQLEWSRCNTNAVNQTSFTVVGLKSMAMYWVQVIATNEGGEGLPQSFDNYIIAMPPPGTDSYLFKCVCFCVSFEASPLPDITWLKDGFPVGKRVTIANFEKGSQLFIYTSELSDTGIYTVNVKNTVGQDTFAIEIRVTDDPKPPGPVELEQNVHDTVTLSWTPSPDEKRDNHLHYMVMKRDSVKQTWRTVVDRLFNNKFTVINILPGREYTFRVFAKNDIGLSEPSVSPVWGTTKKREKHTYSMPVSKTIDFQAAPRFIVPLKLHAAPPGYECHMSCAVTGNPTPHITWYHNNISLNTNPNYYITNVCGVCSLLILRVERKDIGEYKVVAESPLGHDESATKLIIKE